MNIRVAHLYPDYLNIYADRGNIAVLARRAAWRGHELEVTAIGLGDDVVPGALISMSLRPALASASAARRKVPRLGVGFTLLVSRSKRSAGKLVTPAKRAPGMASMRSAVRTTSAAGKPPSCPR